MEINMRGLCPLIQVFDMDNSLHFYCELLGFEIVEKAAGGGWAWLRHGNAELMLNTAYDEGERPEKPDPRVCSHIKTQACSLDVQMSTARTNTSMRKASMFQNRRLPGTG